MDSQVEEQRRMFEEKERLENALVKEKVLKKSSVSLINTNVFWIAHDFFLWVGVYTHIPF